MGDIETIELMHLHHHYDIIFPVLNDQVKIAIASRVLRHNRSFINNCSTVGSGTVSCHSLRHVT